MENLDFLPERTRLQRQRRRRLFRQGYLTVVCIVGLVAVGYLRQGSVQQAQGDDARPARFFRLVQVP